MWLRWWLSPLINICSNNFSSSKRLLIDSNELNSNYVNLPCLVHKTTLNKRYMYFFLLSVSLVSLLERSKLILEVYNWFWHIWLRKGEVKFVFKIYFTWSYCLQLLILKLIFTRKFIVQHTFTWVYSNTNHFIFN